MTNRIINYTAFAILTLLWIGFGAALVLNPQMLNAAWEAFRGWPLIGQAVVALLTLPVVIGLWVWQMDWNIWIRLIMVIGLAWVTIYTFYPKKAQAEMKAA